MLQNKSENKAKITQNTEKTLSELLKENPKKETKQKPKQPKFMKAIEKKTSFSAIYVILPIAVAATFIYFNSNEIFLTNLIGLIYPFYWTIKSLDHQLNNPEDEKQWLVYWGFYLISLSFDLIFGGILAMIPYFYLMKFCFLCWLFLPNFEGGKVFHDNVIRVYFPKMEIVTKTKNTYDSINKRLLSIKDKFFVFFDIESHGSSPEGNKKNKLELKKKKEEVLRKLREINIDEGIFEDLKEENNLINQNLLRINDNVLKEFGLKKSKSEVLKENEKKEELKQDKNNLSDTAVKNSIKEKTFDSNDMKNEKEDKEKIEENNQIQKEENFDRKKSEELIDREIAKICERMKNNDCLLKESGFENLFDCEEDSRRYQSQIREKFANSSNSPSCNIEEDLRNKKNEKNKEKKIDKKGLNFYPNKKNKKVEINQNTIR